MDQDSPVSQDVRQEQNDSDVHREQSSLQNESKPKQDQQNKVVRRPGRPPLRIKNRQKNAIRGNDLDNQNDQCFEIERSRLKEKNYFGRQDRQNNIQGFIKIIDYLKKIQCDEMSLHNKMNPYNLLTPTCFWYMVSAEYFSFDFFNNKNPQQTALQFLKRAQKTQIILPLRVLKPLKLNMQLQFETEQLRQMSIPLTQKLTNLTQLILAPCQTSPQSIQKSNYLTSIAEDNHFRSSTRAMVFNWIKKKIGASEKWSTSLKPKLESISKISPKEFMSKIYQCPQERKHQQLDVAPQIYCRQRRIIKNPLQIKRNRQARRKPQKQKKDFKKQKQDQIFDQSESKQIKIQPEQNQQQIVQEKLQNQGQNENQIIQQKNQQQIKAQQKIQVVEEYQIQKKQIWQQVNDNYDQNSDDDERLYQNKINQYVKISKIYNQDDLLLESILHLPLDNIISILKASIQTPRPHEIQRPYLPIPKNDPLQLVYQIHPDQQVFLNYMKQRQQKMYQDKSSHPESLIQEKEREGQAEDAKCQVCTDGDYTQDNLIVFCSMCNISLHQRCVGLAKVPADNWICEVCASFGPAGINVPCPLCHVKGGALKRTSIHINTPLFKDTNPQYHQFTKKCPNYKHKEQYLHPIRTGIKGQQEPYYDYFIKTTYPTDQPTCHFVWVHYVCAIWVPECYFEQKNGLINIKGIQNIDKKRFKQRCLICKETRAGACVKCDNQNCNKFYHPQCARKKKIYMEQLNLDKLKYLIFCQAHEPLKVKRKIQVKKKKHRDQIVKFCRGIEKYVQTYKIANLSFKLPKLGVNTCSEMVKLDSKKQKVQPGNQKIMIKVQKRTDQDFIKSVIDGLIKQNQIIVNLTNLGNERYKIDQVIKPSKRDMRKSLTRQDQFWKNFKNNQTPENNLKRFNTILRENNYLKQKIQNFINFGSCAQEKLMKDEKKGMRRNVGRRRKQPFQTVIQEQGAIFCVCRKPYDGQDDMFQCEVCNQWYHHECIGFIGSQEDAQKLIFHCMKCLKYESPEAKKQLLDKCGQFFSEDSLFLNYRPPTPSLQSDDEQIKINYNKNEISHNYQNKQFSSRQKLEKQKRKIHSNLMHNQIQDYKINFQVPFIVFDSIQSANPKKDQKIQKKDEMEDENRQQILPSFGFEAHKLIQPHHYEQNDQICGREQNVQAIKDNCYKNQQSLNKQQQVHEISIPARAYSSQSSQLLTPEFRPSIMSFGPIIEQTHQILKSIETEKNESNMRKQKKNDEQREGENQNESNKNKINNIDFHFNRSEIQRLKNQIQQKERNNKEKEQTLQKKRQ